MYCGNYLIGVFNYLILLDIDNLRLYLKDQYTFKEPEKEFFLNEIEKVFEAYKNSGDTELIIYTGKCASNDCPNCGKIGYRFVGNHSKNYMDLLFDTEGEHIKEIFQCAVFKTNEEIKDLGEKADIDIFLDNQNFFNKTPEYNEKLNAANKAWTEIITIPPRQLDFNELSKWVDKHLATDEFIGCFDPFEPCMKWTNFSILYSDLKSIRDYISNHIDKIRIAIEQISDVKTEQDLLEWLLKNEDIGYGAPYCLKNDSFKKVEDHYWWNFNNPIHFKDECFSETMQFIEYFQIHHQEILSKYTTYTNEDVTNIYNNSSSEDEIKNIFSLEFHLRNRGK